MKFQILICLCFASAFAYPGEQASLVEAKPEAPIIPIKMIDETVLPLRSVEPSVAEAQLNDGESLEPAASSWGHGFGRSYGWGAGYGGYGGWKGYGGLGHRSYGHYGGWNRPYHGGYYGGYRSYW